MHSEETRMAPEKTCFGLLAVTALLLSCVTEHPVALPNGTQGYRTRGGRVPNIISVTTSQPFSVYVPALSAEPRALGTSSGSKIAMRSRGLIVTSV